MELLFPIETRISWAVVVVSVSLTVWIVLLEARLYRMSWSYLRLLEYVVSYTLHVC